jgi:hypothetical protein
MESVAILSYAKKDSPVLLYSRSFDHEDDMSFDFFNAEDISNVASSSSSIRSASISSQFRIMCAMDDFDRIEEMKSKSIEKSGDHATGFYLGFLAAMDHFRFYGYKTSTNVRIVIGVKDDLLPSDTELIKQREDSIQTMMVSAKSF